MRDIEGRVRERLRAAVLAAGGNASYADAEIFASVDRALGSGLDDTGGRGSFLALLLEGDPEWRPDAPLRLTSHRSVLGPVILAFKRRVLFPLVRWLHEYTSERFRRQQRVNELLFRALESVAVQHALLERRVAALESERAAARDVAGPDGPRA